MIGRGMRGPRFGGTERGQALRLRGRAAGPDVTAQRPRSVVEPAGDRHVVRSGERLLTDHALGAVAEQVLEHPLDVRKRD